MNWQLIHKYGEMEERQLQIKELDVVDLKFQSLRVKKSPESGNKV
jgi:hypothetical protein